MTPEEREAEIQRLRDLGAENAEALVRRADDVVIIPVEALISVEDR